MTKKMTKPNDKGSLGGETNQVTLVSIVFSLSLKTNDEAKDDIEEKKN